MLVMYTDATRGRTSSAIRGSAAIQRATVSEYAEAVIACLRVDSGWPTARRSLFSVMPTLLLPVVASAINDATSLYAAKNRLGRSRPAVLFSERAATTSISRCVTRRSTGTFAFSCTASSVMARRSD